MNTAKKAALVLATAGMAAGATAGAAFANDNGSGAKAHGAAVGSPGVLSGNLLQVPVHVPVNLCGNSIDIIGLLNPTFGNTCVNR
ncbi:chaplin [Streptomyces varsoviensis]|uniref:chaplin n=1 Tax=Streptomyces varsoviensis TaxID=67373 RepID=UPI0034018C12